MIRPINFGFNDETSMDNHYQKKINKENTAQLAIEEFENMVLHLKNSDVDVHVYNDDDMYKTPDSVFPNNCCLLYTSPSPRDRQKSRMPSSA